jgi:glycosyltransferase involved in cell wall biosynthesis
MNISVIIPTYNGAHKVVKVLESLLLQPKLPDEVLFFVDVSNTQKSIINQRQLDLSFVHIIEQSKQRRAGVRNRGMIFLLQNKILKEIKYIILNYSLC